MFYDLIIVARSTSETLIRMTQECIDSAEADRVILVETGTVNTNYQNVNVTIIYDGEFNYNRALNLGLKEAKGDIHILANNDLIFYDYRDIGNSMLLYGFGSGSAWFTGSRFPKGDFIYEGYYIAEHLTGWCLFITAEALNKIGSLNEDVDFWYSDNIYAEQLRKAGIRHGLFCNARVDHLGSKTLKTMPINIQRRYSMGQFTKYKNVSYAK